MKTSSSIIEVHAKLPRAQLSGNPGFLEQSLVNHCKTQDVANREVVFSCVTAATIVSPVLSGS